MDPNERFDALYATHARSVFAYALRRTSRANADDVLADVFLVAWRRIDELPPEEARAWLLGVARRTLANQRRGALRRSALTERLSRLAPQAPCAGEGDHRVLEALATLRERDREALMLVAWDGLSHSEAAAVLGIREKTFGVRLHRARARLARSLDTLGAGEAASSTPAEVMR
jgi:RNA polymerase sigma-70 factor (ECF subfamily)